MRTKLFIAPASKDTSNDDRILGGSSQVDCEISFHQLNLFGTQGVNRQCVPLGQQDI